ncbi:MAG: cation:dicarboxylase symporter family transporter [Clostridiales bacterium]|jgi:L-cystine uptake protein TcyP (sodium:dicarboxylate symporter family)|nr:cation:dicarboxylase symporter family transporter [Clostridiales bacterium]
MLTKESLAAIISLVVFAGFIALLAVLQKKTKLGFSARVSIALGLGLIFGISLQLFFGAETTGLAGTVVKKWVSIIGSGFTKALQLVIVPLVTVSIINAITKFTGASDGSRKAGRIIGFLLVTTAVSAIVTIVIVKISGLSADKLISFNKAGAEPADVAETLLDLVPSNLFAALASSSVLPVVIVAALIGFAYLAVKKENRVIGERFESLLETAYEIVMQIVDFVISFTPYGILAIIAVRAASGSWQFILQLGFIIIISFVALGAVFLLHLLIAFLSGVSPAKFIKKSSAALLFAFSSRSSAATLPLTIAAQKNLGVDEANANLAGTLGTCIGQNGCAGVYPTILVILVGLVQGQAGMDWNVWSLSFLVPLVIYVVIASIGTAGVGGGATNVSLLVLSLMGLPIELVAILISVDFIIDMGRTLVNVSDSILAGIFVTRFEKKKDKNKVGAKEILAETPHN